MKQFSLQNKLNGILLLQSYKENPDKYLFAGVAGHIGIDISRGDGDPVPIYYKGTVVYIHYDSVVYITDPDENGLALEISQSHGKNFRVKVGDKVEVGQIAFDQDSSGPSIMWTDNDPAKVAWSHEHINIRQIIIGSYNGKYNFWNFAGFSPIPYSYVESDYTMAHFQDPNLYNQKVYSLIAKAIEKKEDAPKEWNNPGAIRGLDGAFKKFVSYEDGFAYLIDYIKRACTSQHASYKPNYTVLQFFQTYAPALDNNNPTKYAKDVVEWVGLRSVNDPIADWLLTEFEWIKKYNSLTFYAPTNDPGKFQQLLDAFKRLWNTYFKGK